MTGLQPTIAAGRSVVAQAQSRPPRTWRRSQSAGRPTSRYRTGNPERLPALSSLPPPRALIGRVLSFGASERPAFVFTGTDIMARRAVRTSPVRTFGPDDL